MKVFIGNLSFRAQESDLQGLLQDYGVGEITIPIDKETGRQRGFAFAEVQDGVRAIADLNGFSFMERDLTVNEARPKEYGGRRDDRGDRRDRRR